MLNVFQKTCRTCLRVHPDVVSIDQLSLYSDPRMTYAEILKDIARLEFKAEQTSNMPQQLCFTCCQQLRKAYMFVKQARESEDKLAKILHTQSEPVTVWLHNASESQKDDEEFIGFEESDLAGSNINLNLNDNPFVNISLDEFGEKPIGIEHTEIEQAPNFPNNFYELEDCNNALDENVEELDKSSTQNFEISLVDRILVEDSASEEDDHLALNVKPNLDVSNSDDAVEATAAKQELIYIDETKKRTRKAHQYKCKHCSRQYGNEFNLKCHLFHKHKRAYRSLGSLKQKRRPRKMTIQCLSCDYTANSYAALHYHKRSKHGSDKDKFKCKFCEYTNLKKFSLFVHMKKSHLLKVKTLKKMRTNKESGDNSYLDKCTEEDMEIDYLDYSSDCSSGDEDVIRDILAIKKRAVNNVATEIYELENNIGNQSDIKGSLLENTSISTLSLTGVNAESLPIDDSDEASEQTKVFKPDLHPIFPCEECPRTFTDRKKFKTHIKNKHDIDFKDFVKKQQKYASEPKVFKCKLCEHIGNSSAAVHFHMRSKHGKEEDKTKCNFCNYTHFKKFSLLTHMMKSHLRIVKRLRAERNSGESLEDLIKSITTIQEPKDKVDRKPNESGTLSCSSGDEDFIRDILNMKKRGGRSNSEKKIAIRCDECGNVYKDSQALNTHKRNVHGEHSYKPCLQCHRKYKRSYDLKLHVLHAHTPSYVGPKQTPKIREKRFMCTECSYVCATSTLLTIHTNRNHTGEKPYKCNVCSKSFVVPFDLKTHKYLHTGERPFKCSVCSKGFRDKTHMLKHKSIHSKVKPYICSDCGKGFTKNYNLSIHKRTHMNRELFNCLVCGKFFKDRAHLSIHQINESHHDEAV